MRLNPSKGPVTVEFQKVPDGAELQLIDAQGKPLGPYQPSERSSTLTVPGEAFEGSGVYYLKLSSHKGQAVKKLLRIE
ncbi:MAG: T9SS type A sorting domain-containing protein [Flavobacteriales bacterium]